MLFYRACLTALLAFLAQCASAQVYAGRDAGGTLVLSNFPSDQTPTLIVAPPLRPAAADPARADRTDGPVTPTASRSIESIVREIALELDLPAQLLHAVIDVESGYDTLAVSRKGARGLMQLMPATAERFGVTNPFDPGENVRGGATYLKWLLQLFGGDVQLALAAYNAGENAVIRAGYRIPPYPETLRYVPRVLARLQRAVRG
jgi:soluble lytic murein transglycosylase-like protein